MRIVNSRESGQILIIFVFALTVLLGFTALALDGGMIFSDRRNSQSVADSASMAGAGAAAQYMEVNGVTYNAFTCTNTKVLSAVNAAYNAAIARAVQNNVTTLDNNLSDKHGIEIICVNVPSNSDRYLEVHTQVTTTALTTFLHLFYQGAAKNTVDAVARIRPRTEILNGNAIVALSVQDGDGIDFNGTGNEQSVVTTLGGGIFSNSDLTCNGKKKVITDSVTYVGSNKKCDDLNPQQVSTPLVISIPPPTCSTTNLGSRTSGTLNPGLYTDFTITSAGTITLNPGLYCLTGDIKLNDGNFDGAGVTIYMLNGSIRTAGSADLQLTAPTSGPMKGILIYMAPGNTNEISFLGSSDQTLGGTVFSPNGPIDIGGNSRVDTPGSVVTFTQLIGYTVKIHGTPEVTISYTPQPLNTSSPKIDLIK